MHLCFSQMSNDSVSEGCALMCVTVCMCLVRYPCHILHFNAIHFLSAGEKMILAVSHLEAMIMEWIYYNPAVQTTRIPLSFTPLKAHRRQQNLSSSCGNERKFRISTKLQSVVVLFT